MSKYVLLYLIRDGVDAAYVNPVAIADLAVKRYCKNWKRNHQITFVLSGDSRTSRTFHSVIVTLKLILPGENLHLTDHIYKLVVGRGTKHYGLVKAIFDVLYPFLIDLKSKVWKFLISTITPKITFCSDLKFLLFVLGLKTAKSSFLCP